MSNAYKNADTPKVALEAHPVPISTIVETGAGSGLGLEMRMRHFKKAIGIELSGYLARRLKKKFKIKKVKIIQGDSREVLKKLRLPNPTFFYLDAHYAADAHLDFESADTFPLWDELEFINKRNKADIVVVDDIHAFSRYTDEVYQKAGRPIAGILTKTGHVDIIDCETSKPRLSGIPINVSIRSSPWKDVTKEKIRAVFGKRVVKSYEKTNEFVIHLREGRP